MSAEADSIQFKHTSKHRSHIANRSKHYLQTQPTNVLIITYFSVFIIIMCILKGNSMGIWELLFMTAHSYHAHLLITTWQVTEVTDFIQNMHQVP